MKCFNLVAAAGVIFFSAHTLNSHAQSTSNPLDPGYYIVVAAYRLGQDAYAESYIKRINNSEINAKYGADLGRKYLYVYLDYFTDYDQSIKEMLETRKKSGFEQAWVRIMKGEMTGKVELVQQERQEPKPTETQTATSPAPATPPAATNGESDQEKTTLEQEEPKVEETTPTKEEEQIEEPEPVTEPTVLGESSVLLSLYNATNNVQVEGEVEVIDTERARLISKVKGNETLKLPDPKNKSGRLTLIANIFGYRPLQHEVNYVQIPGDTMLHYVEWAGNHYVIKFDMVRYHKGDINTLFNVYFFNDAAIMLPESRYQLNNLLAMMKENPNYRIMLHGHTNGNSRGRIITMGPSKSFFTLADDVKEGSGSAKDLSRERASTIKEWLVAQGISADRIETKGWGGGRMLHDKHSVNAKKNVRVDVEILAE